LKGHGFTICYIDVGPEIRRERVGNPDWWDIAAGHESEEQDIAFDRHVYGDISVGELAKRVITIVKEIEGEGEGDGKEEEGAEGQ